MNAESPLMIVVPVPERGSRFMYFSMSLLPPSADLTLATVSISGLAVAGSEKSCHCWHQPTFFRGLQQRWENAYC